MTLPTSVTEAVDVLMRQCLEPDAAFHEAGPQKRREELLTAIERAVRDRLVEVLRPLCDAADNALASRDQDTPPHGAKGYVRKPERDALVAALRVAKEAMELPRDWSVPVAVSTVQFAFPANVIGTLLPHAEDIPKEFFGRNAWTALADSLFAGTVHPDATIAWRPEIDFTVAVRHVGTVLRSFEPKHEHKIAGAAYLLSLFALSVEMPS